MQNNQLRKCVLPRWATHANRGSALSDYKRSENDGLVTNALKLRLNMTVMCLGKYFSVTGSWFILDLYCLVWQLMSFNPANQPSCYRSQRVLFTLLLTEIYVFSNLKRLLVHMTLLNLRIKVKDFFFLSFYFILSLSLQIFPPIACYFMDVGTFLECIKM